MLLRLLQAHNSGTLLLKVGSSCSPLESQYSRGKVGGKEICFISEAGNQGERVDTCPKADSPLAISGQELLKGSFRGV